MEAFRKHGVDGVLGRGLADASRDGHDLRLVLLEHEGCFPGKYGNDGFFEYTIQKDEFTVQLRSHIKLNQAIFAPQDYAPLRDFFAYVVKKQNEQIVFKKK